MSARAAARGTKWLVPVVALAISLLSLLRLNITPERWLNESICEAVGIARFALDPVPCLTIAGITLTYWCIKERDEAAAALGPLAGWITGIPGVDQVILLGIKGLTIMFSAIKRRMYEQIRADNRAESNAEWRAWLQRRMASGTFVPDDKDPPPDQRGK